MSLTLSTNLLRTFLLRRLVSAAPPIARLPFLANLFLLNDSRASTEQLRVKAAAAFNSMSTFLCPRMIGADSRCSLWLWDLLSLAFVTVCGSTFSPISQESQTFLDISFAYSPCTRHCDINPHFSSHNVSPYLASYSPIYSLDLGHQSCHPQRA